MVCQIDEDLLVEDEKFSESERLARWCMAWQVDEDLEDLKEVSVVPIQVAFTNINFTNINININFTNISQSRLPSQIFFP